MKWHGVPDKKVINFKTNYRKISGQPVTPDHNLYNNLWWVLNLNEINDKKLFLINFSVLFCFNVLFNRVKK